MGRLFEEDDYFKYFGLKGAIIRGRRLIEGRLLYEEIRYSYTGVHSKASCHPKSVHPLDRFPVLVILLVTAAAKAIP